MNIPKIQETELRSALRKLYERARVLGGYL